MTDAFQKGLRVPNGKYYLGDAGYGLSKYCMTPFRGVRYHLREWAQGSQKPQNFKELFNLRHAQLRNVIERIFGVAKKRFPILNTAPSYPMNSKVKIVYAVCVLHNLIGGLEDDNYFQQQYDSYADHQQSHQSSDIATGMSSQRDDDKRMEILRAKIAADMWQDYSRVIQNQL